MYLSNRVGAFMPLPAAAKFTPISIVLLVAAAFMLLHAPSNAFAQQGTGWFGGMFGSSSSAPARSSRNYSRYDNNSSGGQFWLESWANSYSSRMESVSRYRTLCVRTCDGFYFPISFSTTPSGFARDAQQCQARCGAPAKLFYHRNPGADVEHMVDLSGQPYAGLKNAFRYRQEVVDSCRCTPQPWSEAAKQEYERRDEIAKNPELAKTAEVAVPENRETPDTRTEVAGWNSQDDQPDATPRRQLRRPAYRANDPALEGRWWAGSW